MTGRALATVPHSDLPDVQTFQTMTRMAGYLFKSGLLPTHIRNEQAAFAVIQKGRELGLPPMYALSNIIVINGKPTAGAECMLALIYRDHGDDAVQFAETTNQRCVVAYKRIGWSQPIRFAFTIEDAKTADLLKSVNWQKFPAAMLRARCISAVARMAFPDSIAGMYTPEELDSEVEIDADGAAMLREPEPEPVPTVDAFTGEIVDGDYTEAAPGPSRGRAPHALITEDRYREIKARLGRHGWTPDDISAWLSAHDADHGRDLTNVLADELARDIQAGRKPGTPASSITTWDAFWHYWRAQGIGSYSAVSELVGYDAQDGASPEQVHDDLLAARDAELNPIDDELEGNA